MVFKQKIQTECRRSERQINCSRTVRAFCNEHASAKITTAKLFFNDMIKLVTNFKKPAKKEYLTKSATRNTQFSVLCFEDRYRSYT